MSVLTWVLPSGPVIDFSPMTSQPLPAPVSAVILAGGEARRLGGQDKALIPFQGRPLLAHLVERLRPQVAELLLSSNRPAVNYAPFGLPVLPDTLPGSLGPLAGLLAGMQVARHPLILSTPCDTPRLPANLVGRLLAEMAATGAPAAAVQVGGKRHPVLLLARRALAGDLEEFLHNGGRAVQAWLGRVGAAWAPFPESAHAFINVNDQHALTQLERLELESPVPVVGFVAWSGTGKTTLLEQLVPELRALGVRVAAIKHAHHQLTLDTPGKDSWRLRQAGAQEVLVASAERFGLFSERAAPGEEPSLAELLPRLDLGHCDLVLVEGFKHEPIPKIELHRPALGKPPLYPDDPRIFAVASDLPLELPQLIPRLDLGNIPGIARFLYGWCRDWAVPPN